MSDHNGSVDSFDEFFGAKKTDNDDDNDKKPKQNHISTSSGVAALIKSQPVVHHRQTPSETKLNINSKKVPLTTNVNNATATLPSKSKRNDSSESKAYESDFDDDTDTDGKKKHSSLPPPKQRSPEPSPRRGSDSKLKASYITTKNSTRRKEKFLPYIRPKNRRKFVPKKQPKSEVEQRILSAQNEKVNKIQSQLAEIRRQLENERIENKTLRLIQKREEKTLQKYEDQEYDVHKIARDYTNEIESVREEIIAERDNKFKLEQDIEEHNDKLRNQTKRLRFYEKLIDEPNLDESDELRERLKQNDKKIKKIQEKINDKDKFIGNLEKKHRHEIKEELIKQRDLKREIQDQSKKYTDLLLRFEDKTRQVDTMHIYIQRGGRRPSISPSSLSKSRSLQSLQDTSPRFREKMIEYDKRRRDEQKLKPKPKPNPLPINPPPKRERKKYVPQIIEKPKTTTAPIVPSHVIHEEKPPIIEKEQVPPKVKPPAHRFSTPNSIDEEKSEIEDGSINQSIRKRTPSPPPPPSRTIQRSEQHLSQAPIYKRPVTPDSPPDEPRFNSFRTDENTTTSSLFKNTAPPPPSKPHMTHEINDKWPDIFDTDKKEESTKEDLISKLLSGEKEEKKSPPTSRRSSMIMFEPSSLSTNGHQKKPPTRTPTANVYDFDQAIINLHEGKPVTTQPATKTSVDPFESLFTDNTDKPSKRINGRDDTFTITQDPFISLFTESSSAANTSTTIKPTIRQIPSQNDKLQRPKVVTNAPKSVPNRTVVEEIEEFIL